MQTEVILNAETESEVLAIHKIKYTAAPQGGDFNLDQRDTCPRGKGRDRREGRRTGKYYSGNHFSPRGMTSPRAQNVQSSAKRWTWFAKYYPGKARQKIIAT